MSSSAHKAMDNSNNNIEQCVQVPELNKRETSKVSLGSSCQVLKSPSEIACRKALTNRKRNGNYGTGNTSNSAVTFAESYSKSGKDLLEDVSTEEILEIDLPFNKAKDTNNDVDDAVSVSSVQTPSPLCQVDPIIDFWEVDEELIGKFRISSVLPLAEDLTILPHQRAVIFKVKTTSPYNFWVRPVVGLMRPNVVSTIEVICDAKASKTTMSRDEFFVEIAPVPGAAAEMTSDLYTSSVPSNLPELLTIWDKMEEESKQGDLTRSKEFHKISCRFRRSLDTLSLKAFEDEKNSKQDSKREKMLENTDNMSNLEEKGNNNVKTFRFEHEDTPIQEYSQTAPKVECYMAREYPAEVEQKQKRGKTNLSFSLGVSGQPSSTPEEKENEERNGTNLSTLKAINVGLAMLLVLSIGYILYISPLEIFS